jgi:hypothetical protein
LIVLLMLYTFVLKPKTAAVSADSGAVSIQEPIGNRKMEETTPLQQEKIEESADENKNE